MIGYLTVDGTFSNQTIIERSKFICQIKGVNDEEEAKQFVAEIRKIHSLATHNCYAYIADEKGLTFKFSDDGEPSGTAGMPMLEVLRNQKIFKAVAVVTRYFGGVKLGAGGLVRAYSSAVSDCLKNCQIVNYKQAFFLDVFPDYDQYSRLMKFYSSDVVCTATEFSESIKVSIVIDKEIFESFKKKFVDAFSGKISFKITGDGYFPFK